MLDFIRHASERLSPHFRRQELACPCCHALQLDPWLLVGLELLRQRLDSPIHVSSGFRCAFHNAAVGGSPNSQHLSGKAADIACPGHGWHMLAECAQAIPYFSAGGIGLYPHRAFIHVDVRGHSARWAFTSAGPADYHALMNETRSTL